MTMRSKSYDQRSQIIDLSYSGIKNEEARKRNASKNVDPRDN